MRARNGPRAAADAFSIGSNGSRLLARIPYSSRRWNGSREPRAGGRRQRSTLSPAAQSRLTVIRFTVSVPVLSTQRTVAAPSVSTAGMRRVSTRLLGDPPGAERQEDGEDDRELLGQRGHRQRDAGQEPLLPHGGGVPPREPVDHDHQGAAGEADDRAGAGPAAPSPSAAGCSRARRRWSALPIFAELGARIPVARTSATPWPAGDERAGEDERQVVAARAARPGGGAGRRAALRTGDRLAGEQRLVAPRG